MTVKLKLFMILLLITIPFAFYLAEVGNYNYGIGHPMKPHRIRMTNDLVINYGLYQHLQVFVSHKKTFIHFILF